MRVFVDTNVLIDFVCDRVGFAENADQLFALGCLGEIQLMTSSLSYVTAMYVAHKYDYQKVKKALLANADCIVTRNKKDFVESTLPIYSVSELLEELK